MQLLLIRHPAPKIETGICYGRLDVPLLPDAARSIDAIVAAIRGHAIATLRSSPALRCLAVARAAATALRGTITVDDRLQELDFGAWEGQRWNSIALIELDRWAADPRGFSAPGGETGDALTRRVTAVFAELRAAGEDCAVISHGGPLRLLHALAAGREPDLLAASQPFGSVIPVRC